jgi:hypothetical protein
MATAASLLATQLRHELIARNRIYARGRAFVESYGEVPVIVYAPEGNHHGNFFDSAYQAILANPAWMHRFDKMHAQATRSLPKADRRWRELDSSMSSDALLMNIFCTPGVVESPALCNMLGVEIGTIPDFGWKARVPLHRSRFDRTEVDMCIGPLLVEAKLTESDFQCRAKLIVETYRDFDEVFDCDLLPQVSISVDRARHASEFPENQSQEFESMLGDPDLQSPIDPLVISGGQPGYGGYQLIRNVLAAYATGSSFCVLHDARRPDLREQWFSVLAAVRSPEFRTRLKVLTWQELTAFLPEPLQQFLDVKYGISAPGKGLSSIGERFEDD